MTWEERISAAYRALRDSEDGCIVLADIIDKGGIFREHGVTNAGIYYMEGKRAMALHVLQLAEFTGPTSNSLMPEVMGLLTRVAEIKEKFDAVADSTSPPKT